MAFHFIWEKKKLHVMRTFEVFAKEEERFSLKRADFRRMMLVKVVNIDMNVGFEICTL